MAVGGGHDIVGIIGAVSLLGGFVEVPFRLPPCYSLGAKALAPLVDDGGAYSSLTFLEVSFVVRGYKDGAFLLG